jgi:hypothetical protein
MTHIIYVWNREKYVICIFYYDFYRFIKTVVSELDITVMLKY